MSSVGGSDRITIFVPLGPTDVNLKQISLSQASVSIGGVVLAVARNVTCRWSNEVRQESVIGTDVPLQWTGPLRGTVDIEWLECSDFDLTALVNPGSDGQVPESTFTEVLVDSESTPKQSTWTFKARLNQPEIVTRLGDIIRARVTGVLTSRPTRTQA
jgi:hypothetical protein